MPDAWGDWNDWSIGGVLFPHMQLNAVGGFSEEQPTEWGGGAHDPSRRTFSLQAFEPGVSLRTEYVEGYANFLGFQNADGDWRGDWEEGFLKLHNLPGGFEVRGGRMLSRFGALNNRHLHGRDFIDFELSSVRMLGEHGLLLNGADISWNLPSRDLAWSGMITLGFGESAHAGEDHGHGGHGGGDDHDDHGDGHDEDHGDDHDEDHGDDHDDHEDHDHGGGGRFDSHEAALESDIFTSRAVMIYRSDDFHTFTGGLSVAGGTNGFGRDTYIGNVDFEYLWRENGMEPGGKAFLWRNEYTWRHVDARDVAGVTVIEDSFQESGFATHLVGSWNSRLDTGLRLAWVEGADGLGLDERFRISPAITWWFEDSRRMNLRLQTNHDFGESGRENHAVWLQFSMALGNRNEVR